LETTLNIIQKNNVFSKSILEQIQDEVFTLKPHLVKLNYSGGKFAYRFNFDDYYKNRQLSVTLANIKSVLYDKELVEACTKIQDYSFQRLKRPHKYITLYSEFRDGLDWHDDMDNAFMNWIIYLADDFEDGDLVVKFHDEELVIKPEVNKLVMLPSHLLHMVKEPTYKTGQLRKTINGYMF